LNEHIEGFLIDLDGTIIENSPEIAIDFTVDFVNKYTPIAKFTIKDFFRTCNKFPQNKLFYLIFSYLGIEDHLNEFVKEFQKLNSYNNKSIQFRKGFFAFLEKCRNYGLKSYLFSSQSTERINNSLRNCSEIEVLDIYDISKSNANELHSFLEKKNMIAKNWYLIDDDPFIARTGKLVGLNTILMENQLFTLTEILEYKQYYDYSFKSFEEVSEKILDDLMVNLIRSHTYKSKLSL
jgi:predicted HAD superfamily phosphohydrolase YqeG